jgi:redox-sensitive bicupin YhaK (pirin superfamily)
MGMTTYRRSEDRGHANHGWLDTYHTFSFADYRDERWMGYRSLRVLNDDLVMPRMGFPEHPHRDMEILTYVLSGALEHRDSLGNGRIVRAGDLQYMAAGTGVRHSERNPSADEAVHFLQIWIEPETTGLAPRYADKDASSAAPGRLHLVASRSGRDGSIAIHRDVDLWLARLAPGDRVAHVLAAGRHAWLHVAEGSIKLDGQALRAGDAAALPGPAVLTINAVGPSQILLFDLD